VSMMWRAMFARPYNPVEDQRRGALLKLQRLELEGGGARLVGPADGGGHGVLHVVRRPQRILGIAAQVELKAKLESSSSYFRFNTLSSRRFQHGFDRVNLHRPTFAAASSGGHVSSRITGSFITSTQIEIGRARAE